MLSSWLKFLVIDLELLTLPEPLSLPSVLSGVRVTRSLVLCVLFCRSLFVLLSLFFWQLHCLSFFDYRFWLPLWYLQTLLVATILNIPPLSQYLSSIIYISLSMLRPYKDDYNTVLNVIWYKDFKWYFKWIVLFYFIMIFKKYHPWTLIPFKGLGNSFDLHPWRAKSLPLDILQDTFKESLCIELDFRHPNVDMGFRNALRLLDTLKTRKYLWYL